MDRHLPEPGGLHPAVRDGGADQPVLAQTLRVDDVLPGLGRDVLAELSLVAGEELQERARVRLELVGWIDTHGKTEVLNLHDGVRAVHGEVVFSVWSQSIYLL